MYRNWIRILIMLALLFGACGLGTTVVEETAPATATATPFVDLNDLAARTLTPTALPTETPEPTETATPLPTPTEEALVELASDNATPAKAVSAEMGDRYFVVQDDTPVGMPNWAHAEAGCNWLGVAGQLFDLAGDPAINLVVEVGGTLAGEPVLGLALTGLDSVYGPGGYEIQLAEEVIASHNEVWLQVKNAQGQVLSEPIFVTTYADCNQNLILLNFVELETVPTPPPDNQVFLPFIVQQGLAP